MIGAAIGLYTQGKLLNSSTHDSALWMMGGGLFAMIPDATKLIGIRIMPEVGTPTSVIIRNLFVAHGLLDMLDTTDSLWVGTGAILFCVIVIVLTHGDRQ